MDEKVASYTGGLHVFRSYLKEKWGTLKEQGTAGTIHELKERTGEKVSGMREKAITNINRGVTDDYSHIYRRKTRLEMVRISAAVMGIEFCYAAETAFVSPTLLKIGVRHRHMTLIWCLSPFVGFFLTPILGSLSDNCRSRLGRRRPFIILLSIGIILGLILVPNGKAIGISLGDQWNTTPAPTPPPAPTLSPKQVSELLTATEPGAINATSLTSIVESLPKGVNITAGQEDEEVPPRTQESHHWGIFFTILGTMLLDFDADACQSPSRAYLLDVTTPEDHAVGLSTFTIMAGLGGGLGYAMGGINWDVTFVGRFFGGHVRAVFTIVTFIFIACVVCTLYSFTEIPLDVLTSSSKKELQQGVAQEQQSLAGGMTGDQEKKGYGTLDPEQQQEVSEQQEQPNGHGADPYYGEQGQGEQQGGEQNYEQLGDQAEGQEQTQEGLEESDEAKGAVAKATLRQYLLSIVYMPRSLRVLCVTNLFCWMSLVCYSLYFTDFVGEAVFQGDPKAPDGTRLKVLYEDGVRFGCWGMALYSLSCSVYSFLIEKLVKRFTARPVYIYGQLVYSIGMVFMAIFRHPAAVIIFSCCAGVMYSTLFTMPYLLVAHYHASEKFGAAVQGDVEGQAAGDPTAMGGGGPEDQVRGLGTDVAIVSSMVFLAQFILSLCMGTIISVVGSTTAVVCMASFLAMCGSISATQVVYLDL